MKAYIGYKKTKGKLEYGLTVYDNNGKVLFSNVKTAEDFKTDGKFLNTLKAYTWGIKQVNVQTERGLLNTEDKIHLMLNNKTIYNWFETGGSIRQYSVEFSDLMFEINLLMNDIEVIQADNSDKYVLYCRRGTTEDTGFQKLTTMFEGVD